MAKHVDKKDKNKKRVLWWRFGLAGLAVTGIGAAVTTAAWTDNVWFSAQADTQDFDLKGSIDGVTWHEGQTADSAIEFAVDPNVFSNIVPGGTYTTDLMVKNFSANDALLDVSAQGKGDLFTVGGEELTVNASLSSAGTQVLSPNETATIKITVAADDSLTSAAQGEKGNIIVKIVGSTVAP